MQWWKMDVYLKESLRSQLKVEVILKAINLLTTLFFIKVSFFTKLR